MSNVTATKLRAACESLLNAARHPDDVTVRRIVARAGTSIGAVNYHFGSLEQLVFEVGRQVYLRLNAERLALLQAAVQRHRTDPVPSAELIHALVGPSIRWSLDPQSSYGVLRHLTSMAQSSHHPEIFRPMIEDIEHHRAFVPHFRKGSPWLTDAEIGFRISCVLGVRSQMTRNRERTIELSGAAIDMCNADTVVAHVVAATAPMFSVPPSNSVQNLSRH